MRKLTLYLIKNSHAIIEKITIAVKISPILLSSLNADVANLLPTLKNTISIETGIPLPYLDDEIRELENKKIIIKEFKMLTQLFSVKLPLGLDIFSRQTIDLPNTANKPLIDSLDKV